MGVAQVGDPAPRRSAAALPFPPLMALAAADDSDLVSEATTVQAANLTDLGFSIDFAPDADVTTGPDDVRSEERRVGKESRARRAPAKWKKNKQQLARRPRVSAVAEGRRARDAAITTQ